MQNQLTLFAGGGTPTQVATKVDETIYTARLSPLLDEDSVRMVSAGGAMRTCSLLPADLLQQQLALTELTARREGPPRVKLEFKDNHGALSAVEGVLLQVTQDAVVLSTVQRGTSIVSTFVVPRDAVLYMQIGDLVPRGRVVVHKQRAAGDRVTYSTGGLRAQVHHVLTLHETLAVGGAHGISYERFLTVQNDTGLSYEQAALTYVERRVDRQMRAFAQMAERDDSAPPEAAMMLRRAAPAPSSLSSTVMNQNDATDALGEHRLQLQGDAALLHIAAGRTLVPLPAVLLRSAVKSEQGVPMAMFVARMQRDPLSPSTERVDAALEFLLRPASAEQFLFSGYVELRDASGREIAAPALLDAWQSPQGATVTFERLGAVLVWRSVHSEQRLNDGARRVQVRIELYNLTAQPAHVRIEELLPVGGLREDAHTAELYLYDEANGAGVEQMHSDAAILTHWSRDTVTPTLDFKPYADPLTGAPDSGRKQLLLENLLGHEKNGPVGMLLLYTVVVSP